MNNSLIEQQPVKIDLQVNRSQELDALRGLAALMVVLFHFTVGRPEAGLGFRLGTTGVDLFFIISGFVIFMSLTKIKTSVDFIINRISRLYPTYWFCVTFTFILANAKYIISNSYNIGRTQKIEFIDYLANMTMFQFYFKIPNIDGPYWTLIIEMIFYMGILFLYHAKLLRYLNAVGLSLLILVVSLASLFYDISFVKKLFYWVPLLQFIPLFFAGIVFYKLYNNSLKKTRNYGIIVLCLVSQILLFKCAGRSHSFINQAEYAGMLVLYFILFTMFVNGKLKFIITRVTLFLGKISYSLYLIHQFISIYCIIPFLTDRLHVNFWIASLLVSLPTVVILATIITYYVEIPLSKIMKNKLRAMTVS